jgi:hypothetical protein
MTAKHTHALSSCLDRVCMCRQSVSTCVDRVRSLATLQACKGAHTQVVRVESCRQTTERLQRDCRETCRGAGPGLEGHDEDVRLDVHAGSCCHMRTPQKQYTPHPPVLTDRTLPTLHSRPSNPARTPTQPPPAPTIEGSVLDNRNGNRQTHDTQPTLDVCC